MTCKNEVSYMVERGNTMQYREIFIRCGNTDPHGQSAICDQCENDPKTMQSIRNHQANVDADNAWNESAGWGEMQFKLKIGVYHVKPNRTVGLNIFCDYTNRLLFISGLTRSY